MNIEKKWKIPLSADISKTRKELIILVNNIKKYIHQETLNNESLDVMNTLIKDINMLEPNLGNYYKALFAKNHAYHEEKFDTEKESFEEHDDDDDDDDEGDNSDLDYVK